MDSENRRSSESALDAADSSLKARSASAGIMEGAPSYFAVAVSSTAVFGDDEDGPAGAVQDLEGDVVARDHGARARAVAADDDRS